jgi:hypothetical protein
LLFYSFQATSSDFRLITTKNNRGSVLGDSRKQFALCVNNYTLLRTDAVGGIVMGMNGCPDWEHARPAAVVNIEHPAFSALGFIVLLAGFLLQYLSVPQPKTVAQMREELKRLKAEQKNAV